MTMAEGTELALDWLVRSDIRYTGENSVAQGCVCQGYNWRERSYPFIYSEITGYAVSALVNAYRWTGNDTYLDLARESAGCLRWIQGLAVGETVEGAMAHGLSLPGLALQPQYYSFDCAMCLQGLLDLDAIDPSAGAREVARAIGDWLVERAQREDGAFLAVHDAETEEWIHEEDNVFGDGGCLHAKHAIGLLKLGAATGESRYTAAARAVCDWVLGLQDEDGAFRATEGMEQVVSHAHCYATEGLLFAHHELGEKHYLAAARRAGEWLLGVQNRDGSINIAYKRRWWRMGRRVTEIVFPRRVTDATAQSIRIWLALYYLDGDRRFLDGCTSAEGFLRRMQCTSSADRNAVGGVYFWPDHPMMFAWCTMFALHALYALEHIDREDGYGRIMAELF
jgi:uncharacterized protein YyaL (SSP411 family)